MLTGKRPCRGPHAGSWARPPAQRRTSHAPQTVAADREVVGDPIWAADLSATGADRTDMPRTRGRAEPPSGATSTTGVRSRALPPALKWRASDADSTVFEPCGALSSSAPPAVHRPPRGGPPREFLPHVP